MVKNLTVSSEKVKVNKSDVHKIVIFLKKELKFTIFALEINFVSNQFLLEINKKYLEHDYYTDIITFNYTGDTKILDGEIFISYEEALKNSKKFNCSFTDELRRLIIHGILHLIGYDDMQESDRKIMKKMENEFVEKTSKLNIEKIIYEN